MRRKRFTIATVLFALCVLAAVQLGTASPVDASTRRLHVFQFNACDQYGTSHSSSACRNTRWYDRADAISASIQNWSADAVTLQEVCQSTYNRILRDLGSGWHGYFKHTYVTAYNDFRCGGSGGAYWGIAILAKSPVSDVTAILLEEEPDGEARRLLCGNVTIGSGFRLCSTHLSNSSDNAAQAEKVSFEVNYWVSRGAAVLLGGDLNINVRNCTEAASLSPLYYGGFGPSRCESGYGHLYEADKATSWGDGTYDEPTYGSAKIDYVFFNRQRFYADYGADATYTSVSDHRPMRAAVTIHD
jgi:endonuclease/exonuclease/phosphatase family metal-dependent hydrolase